MRTSIQLDALMPRTRQQILAKLLLNPERRWYLRELSRELGLSPSSLQLELKNLSGGDIISRFDETGRILYQANRDLPYFSELQAIFKRTVAVDSVLRKALDSCREAIAIAFVYGSFASHTEVNSSDIDLAIISDTNLLELWSGVREAERALHREINVVQYSPADLRHAWMEQRNFVRTIVSSPKFFLIGDPHVLAATLGEPSDQDAPDYVSRNQCIA